ncbi:MAG: hypothetical protein V3V85_04175 [Candidatus Thorarchaeota archaeon]
MAEKNLSQLMHDFYKRGFPILEGTGDGTKASPLTQDIQSLTIEESLNLILIQMLIQTAILREMSDFDICEEDLKGDTNGTS